MRRYILLVIITVSILANLSSVMAESRYTEADLYSLFDVEKVGANLVIAVDTSLSMKKSFSEVTEALSSFSRTLQPTDTLTVITFDNKARVVYSGSAKNQVKIKKALPGRPNPKGNRTDMGVAVKLVLDELKKSKGRLPVVVFMTDGVEDPPKGSLFAKSGREAWQQLTDRARLEEDAKAARVHGVAFNANTDIGKLKEVWPQTQPLTVSPSELSVYFGELKEKIRRERLRLEVNKELDQGKISIEAKDPDWGGVRSGTTLNQDFTVTSSYRKLPVEITVSKALWSKFESTTEQRSIASGIPKLKVMSERTTLAPGQERELGLKVHVPKMKGKFGLRSEEKYRGNIQFDVAGSTPYAAAIAELNSRDPRIKVVGADQRVWFNRPVGQSLYVLLALALSALAMIAMFWRRALVPLGQVVYRRIWAPTLFGRLAFSGAPQGERLPRPLNLAQFGRRTTIGSAGQVKLSGHNIEESHAEVFTKWEEGAAKVMIQQRDGAVRVAGSTGATPMLITGPTQLDPGSVIQIGDYKIQWI